MNAARAECRFGVRRSAQLDLLRAHFSRGFDLMRIGIDKQTRQNLRL
jgi:hypothetical protein